MFNIYAAFRNQDMTEGRGPMVIDRIFARESDAEEYILQQHGVMGRKPADYGEPSWAGMGDWEVKRLAVMESLDDIDTFNTQAARESALAKLTAEEKIALGLA